MLAVYVTAGGVVVGALLGLLVYLIVGLVLGLIFGGASRESLSRPIGTPGVIAAILGLLVFVSYALGWG